MPIEPKMPEPWGQKSSYIPPGYPPYPPLKYPEYTMYMDPPDDADDYVEYEPKTIHKPPLPEQEIEVLIGGVPAQVTGVETHFFPHTKHIGYQITCQWSAAWKPKQAHPKEEPLSPAMQALWDAWWEAKEKVKCLTLEIESLKQQSEQSAAVEAYKKMLADDEAVKKAIQSAKDTVVWEDEKPGLLDGQWNAANPASKQPQIVLLSPQKWTATMNASFHGPWTWQKEPPAPDPAEVHGTIQTKAKTPKAVAKVAKTKAWIENMPGGATLSDTDAMLAVQRLMGVAI
jgi:hypothetical protein